MVDPPISATNPLVHLPFQAPTEILPASRNTCTIVPVVKACTTAPVVRLYFRGRFAHRDPGDAPDLVTQRVYGARGKAVGETPALERRPLKCWPGPFRRATAPRAA
jgi:hypothetical protein